MKASIFEGSEMRSFLDAILSFIGAASLTDEEFDSVTITVQDYSVQTYQALLEVIDNRELVSTVRYRLTYYFRARGVDVSPSSVGRSNILVGGLLCD
jgi:hypothetical protein